MNWIETKIFTTHEGIEPVTGALLEIGITGFSIEDAQDFAHFLETQTPYWDYVDESLERLKDCETSMTVYLADNAQGLQQFDDVIQALSRLKRADTDQKWGRLQAVTSSVNEDDWANNWKQYFKPTPVGEKLLVKPTWETLDETQRQGRIVLEIDPSASFGTGTHATTRLCMQLLEQVITGGEKVLDMGCGSGILSIAAMLLGAESVRAVDIDENAVRIAQENFVQNRISPAQYQTFCGDVNQNEALRLEICQDAYHVVVANIVADVIIAMAETLKACMMPTGALLLSGIIDTREADVINVLDTLNLHVIKRMEEGGWISLCVKR